MKFFTFLKYSRRRSPRFVCTNLGEGYRKRRYSALLISKLSDAEAKNTETQIWIDFAKECNYINEEQYKEFTIKNNEVGKLI